MAIADGAGDQPKNLLSDQSQTGSRPGQGWGELVPVSDSGQGSAGEGSSSSWAEARISQKLGSLENTGLVSVFCPKKRLEPQRKGGPAWPGRAPGSPGQPRDAHTVLFTEGSLGQLGCPLRASPATSRSASRPGDAICGGSGSWPAAPAGRRGCMCQLGQAPGRRGGQGGGSPCRRSAAEPSCGRAKHNSGRGRAGRAPATEHPGLGCQLWPRTAVSMALGVAVTTGAGWPGAGPRGWQQARNQFARGPAASTFLKAWPGPGVQALPADGGEGGLWSAVLGWRPRPSHGPALCAVPARRARPRHSRFWKCRALSCQTAETSPSPALSIVKALP